MKEVIVVEGRDDTAVLKSFLEVDTIETGGSALSKDTLAQIALAQKKRGVIILTDPDYPGERLRKMISNHVPGCKHAFLSKAAACSKRGKIGVEHAHPDDIWQALQEVRTEGEGRQSDIEWKDLFDFGLVGGKEAKKRREEIGHLLGIGYANAQQFYKRLHMFRISLHKLKEAYKKRMEESPHE